MNMKPVTLAASRGLVDVRSLLLVLLACVWGSTVAGTLSDTLSGTLDERDVSRYIEATLELHQYEDQFDDFEDAWATEDDDDFNAERIRSMISDSLAFMREQDREAYQLVDRVSRKHGFSSAEAYGQVGDRVMLAFLAVEMEDMNGGFDAQMQEALDEIENSEFFSSEQKESMRQMIRQARDEMAVMFQAPEADKRAIEPYLPVLRELVSFGDDEL